MPQPPPSTTLLLAAVHTELDAVVRRLELMWRGDHAEGTIHGHRIVAVVTGIGAQRAVAHITPLLATYTVTRVVHLGFAGGLDPSLRAGDVLHVGRVCNGRGETVTLDGSASALMVTVDQLAATVADKCKLYEATGATAVDMETYLVAEALQQRGIPLIALRAISDPADTALPRTALQWVNPQGRARAARAILWLLRHPGECFALWRLSRRVRRAAANLATEVERLLEQETEPQTH